METKVNLAEKFALLEQPYAPAIVGYVNDYKLQIVKVKGEFVCTNTTTPTTSSWWSRVV
jgi:hypothetical protein